MGLGYLIDRVSAAKVGVLAYSTPAVALLILLLVPMSPLVGGIASFMLGFAIGTELDVVIYLTSRHVGTKVFGAIFGLIVGLQGLAGAIGPLAGSLVFDTAGSYRPLLIALIPAFLVSMLLISTLGSYPDFADKREGVLGQG